MNSLLSGTPPTPTEPVHAFLFPPVCATRPAHPILHYIITIITFGVILRWIFRKWDVGAWIGSIWLRIGTGGGHL